MKSIDIKKALIDTVLAGLVALIVFGPIVGVVLQGYDFTPRFDRVGWLVGTVMAGRLLLSLFLQTTPGRSLMERFDSAGSGVGVKPPGHASHMR
jgi:branched-chain amino acid transport system permease protein